MTDVRLWKTRLNGTEYGPYTTDEMFSYVTQQRIGVDTEVQHPQVTQGLWLTAKNVKILLEKLEESAIPPVQNIKRETETTAQPYQAQPYYTSPQAYPTRRTQSRYSSFKWALLMLWGFWSVGLACYLLMGIVSYDQIGHGGSQTFYYVDSVPFSTSAWFSINILRTAFVGLLSGVPVFIVSVILYFFMTDK